MMKSYLIESLAPLVFRSGKPFGSAMSAQDMIFPLPSAGAGLVRALSITQGKTDFNTHRTTLSNADYQKVLAIKSYGVYLAKYSDDNKPVILLPKPANSLYVEKDGKIELVRLAPKAIDDDCGSDLPDVLLYVQTVDKNGNFTTIKGKPKSGVNFWVLSDVLAWQNGKNLSYEDIAKNGVTNILTDIRTHVAIDDETLSSEDGKLFQTASYDLNYQKQEKDGDYQGFNDTRLGFAVLTDEILNDDLAVLGGERRLSNFKDIDSTLQPDLTDSDVQAINNAKGFSLTFITPSIFSQGYLPSWIDENTMTGTLPNSDVKVRLKAAAIDRWQAVSGWDSLLWQPKAMRKAVSAGSVYWFELVDNIDSTTLQALQKPLADDNYDRNDGFGMAVVAPFSFSF